MKRKLSVLILTLAILTSALAPAMEVVAQRRRPLRRSFPPTSSTPNLTARFNQIADEYLKGYYSFNPTEATTAGLHEYDAQLESRNSAAIAREVRRLHETLNLLARLNPAALTEEARYDYLVLASHARTHPSGGQGAEARPK